MEPVKTPTTSADPSPPAPASDGLAPGSIFAERYRIVRRIGEGGMAAVYVAEHVHVRKQVAIKILNAAMGANAEARARFEREAVAAASIDHPNVARANDFGQLPDKSFFFVMELIAGASLREEITKGPLAPERAVRITRGILAGVGAAHAQGVIHRDLKPDNVMLAPGDVDGEEIAKVLDFGVAKVDVPSEAAESSQPLTKLGMLYGTPDYMSPEQALGEAVDNRSDIYAIGLIFYEMLTGVRVFSGGAMTVLRDRLMQQNGPDLFAVQDARIREVIAKMLARDRDQRYASAAEALAAMQGLDAPTQSRVPAIPTDSNPAIAHSPTVLAASGTTRSPIAQELLAPHNRRQVLAGAGAIAVLVVLLVVVVVSKGSGKQDRTAAPTASATALGKVELPPPPAATAVEKIAPAPVATADETPAPEPSTRTKARGRRTGPGGIYIPPPRTWFK